MSRLVLILLIATAGNTPLDRNDAIPLGAIEILDDLILDIVGFHLLVVNSVFTLGI